MATRKLRPQDTPRLDAAEFGIVFQIALDVGQDLSNADASSPYERASFALKQYFGDRSEDFLSANYRFRALMDLYTRDHLRDWVRRADGASARTEIHPAVLDTASRLRLAGNGRFPVRKFLEEVAQTARQHYADLDQWPLG